MDRRVRDYAHTHRRLTKRKFSKFLPRCASWISTKRGLARNNAEAETLTFMERGPGIFIASGYHKLTRRQRAARKE